MGGLQLENRSALVTGAGSGIGAAIARRLAEEGARVVVADYNEQAAQDVAAELRRAGFEAASCFLDVTKPQSAEAAVAFVVKTYGALNLAVNNAGISAPMVPVDELGIEDWQRVIDTNLSGVFYCLKYEVPAMLAAGGGAIVNTGSMFSAVGRSDFSASVAAKHGVVGLTRAAALDYATRGIRVNAVGPGVIDTPLLHKHADEAAKAFLTAMHPMGRFGTTSEVAELTAFLLSDRAGFITGGLYMIDGGSTAR